MVVAAGGARGGGGGGGDDGDGGRSLCLLLVAVTTDAAWRSGGRGGSPGSSSVWVWREGGGVGVFQHRARAGLSRVPGWKLSASGWSVAAAEEAAVWQCGSGHLAPDRRSRPTGHCVQPGLLLPAQHPTQPAPPPPPPPAVQQAQARLCLAGPPADTRRSWFIMHNLYSENIHNNLAAKKSFKSIFGFFKSNSHVSPECRGRSLREVGGRGAERDWRVGGSRARRCAWLLPRRRCAVPRGGARDSSFICGGGRRD